jgi:Prephenate dehydrogenase
MKWCVKYFSTLDAIHIVRCVFSSSAQRLKFDVAALARDERPAMFCGIAGPNEVAGVAIRLNCRGVKPRSVLSIDWRACSTDPARRSRRGGRANQPPAATRRSALASLLGPGRDVEVADHELARRLAATGWRDMTRLAGSAWSVWRDIWLTNRPNISNALGSLIAELQSLKDALDARDFNRARGLFTEANRSVAEQRALHYSRFEKL